MLHSEHKTNINKTKFTIILILQHQKRIDSIGEDVSQRLQRPLMCKSVSKPGLLECNIDRYLILFAPVYLKSR